MPVAIVLFHFCRLTCEVYLLYILFVSEKIKYSGKYNGGLGFWNTTKLIVTVRFLSCLTVKFVYDVYPKNVRGLA